MYRKWAFPYEKKFFDAINPECIRYNAASILHICGNMTPVLDCMADTGAQIIELDTAVSLAEAKARIGDRVCLMGNIHPTAVLLQGTLMKWRRLVKRPLPMLARVAVLFWDRAVKCLPLRPRPI